MVKIDKRSFDSIMMTARGTAPDGTTVKIKMTYAFSPGISAYDESNGRWLCNNEWEWVNV